MFWAWLYLVKFFKYSSKEFVRLFWLSSNHADHPQFNFLEVFDNISGLEADHYWIQMPTAKFADWNFRQCNDNLNKINYRVINFVCNNRKHYFNLVRSVKLVALALALKFSEVLRSRSRPMKIERRSILRSFPKVSL